jgi:aldehyde dehydrogenase (NAD+)
MGGTTFQYEFDCPLFKAKVEFPTGLFIDGKWLDGSEGNTIEYVNDT